MKKQLIFLFALALLAGCGMNEENKEKAKAGEEADTEQFAGLQQKAASLFGQLPEVAENPNNPLTPEKIALGKKLYFDVRLSKDNTQSCNTCHNLETYGVDNDALSEGNDGGLGDRNSPTTLNAALHMTQFWDGREPDVEAQAGGPILNPAEMAMPSEEAVVERLSGIEEYNTMFAEAFPEDKEPISYDNIKKAIGAFERILITPSRFDLYLAGDETSLTVQEKKGLQTFMDAGCIACHMGNLLGGNMYQKFGLYGDYWTYTHSDKVDDGRYAVTEKESDKFMFKVPTLRNVEKTHPYLHDGSIADLKEVISIMAKTQLNKELSEEEIEDMFVFLAALTGEVPEI